MINLIKQTDSSLPYVIRRYGCNLRCLQAIAELEAQKSLTPDEIIFIYEKGLKEHHISDKCFVENNDAIIAETGKYLGLKTVPRYNEKNGPYARLHYSTGLGGHFVLINPNRGLFNPDESLDLGHIMGIRYYA